MKLSARKAAATFIFFWPRLVVSYPGELVYGCAVKEKDWAGPYNPWAGNTKHAHAHLTFDDGPFVGDTDVVLDILKEYDTKATFFLNTDKMTAETRYLVDRMVNEGHMIGSHTTSHKNLQYMNETLLEDEIVDAHYFLEDFLGFKPKLFRPPFGGIDDRSHKLLEDLGYTIVLWSAGCVDWWFTENEKDLESSIAAMRYSLAEAGGIICMHDTAQAPNNGERLRKFLDDTWNFWQYVDFLTCIDREDVDEGIVFKSYDEYRRALSLEAAVDKGSVGNNDDEPKGAASVSSTGEVYLTFDDGPIDATFDVLDVLSEMGVSATFFLNGFHLFGEGDENEDKSLAALKRTVDDGHIIANHSFNHMLHNCCNDAGECGAVVCNEIGMWNVGAYQDVTSELNLFHLNTQVIRQLLKSHTKGRIAPNDMLGAMARLPYTNSYRIDGTNSDCACCTSDDVPPWDESFTCTLDKPTYSATLAALVADELKSAGMDVFGWDLEWSPDNWGADDPASTLTSAEDLAQMTIDLAQADSCEAHSAKANIAYCDSNTRHDKVVILTHDFLFEDGGRGMGATKNLPKLREFIRLMKNEGFVFKTLDQYGLQAAGNGGEKEIHGQSAKAEKGGGSTSKNQDTKGSKSAKYSAKSTKNTIAVHLFSKSSKSILRY